MLFVKKMLPQNKNIAYILLNLNKQLFNILVYMKENVQNPQAVSVYKRLTL